MEKPIVFLGGAGLFVRGCIRSYKRRLREGVGKSRALLILIICEQCRYPVATVLQQATFSAKRACAVTGERRER